MKKKGICSVCGVAPGPLFDAVKIFANVKQTICLVCAPLPEKQREQKRADALAELKKDLDRSISVTLAIQARIRVLAP